MSGTAKTEAENSETEAPTAEKSENGAGARTSPDGAAAQGQPPAIDRVGVLGHAVWLMSQSPMHRHFFMTDIEWLLLPPIVQGQFRLWRKGNLPEGFATWAFVTDEVEARLKEGIKRLAPQEWNAGPNLWLMDLITPFGGQENALADLKKVAFKDRHCKMLRLDPETQKMTLAEI